MKTLIFIMLLIPALCFAQVREIKVLWTYESELTEGGFKIYQLDNAAYNLVVDITNIAAREWEGDVDLHEGENLFAMTAYDATNESIYSNTYPLNNDIMLEFLKPILFSITCK